MNTDNLKKEVRKLKIGHIALLCAGVFLAFAIIGSILLYAGGAWIFDREFNWKGLTLIGPGQTYDINERKEFPLDGINRIDVITVSDEVTIVSGGASAAAELNGQIRTTGKPRWLDARVQGSTLTIEVKYPPTIGFNSGYTKLAVTIPEAYAGNLSVRTVSGSIKAQGLPYRLDTVNLNTVSGGIDFGTAACANLSAGTVSGRIVLKGISGAVRANTTSGRVSLDYAEFADTTVSTVSGSVEAAIPSADKFGVDFSSLSGRFQSTHPSLDVNHADRGFRGGNTDGGATLRVSTTSGSLNISGK